MRNDWTFSYLHLMQHWYWVLYRDEIETAIVASGLSYLILDVLRKIRYWNDTKCIHSSMCIGVISLSMSHIAEILDVVVMVVMTSTFLLNMQVISTINAFYCSSDFNIYIKCARIMWPKMHHTKINGASKLNALLCAVSIYMCK